MAKESELIGVAEDASRLRARWNTSKGRALRGEILSLIKKRESSWPDLLKELPGSDETNSLDDLRGINLEGQDLAECDLSFTDLSHAIFRGCNLRALSLQGSNLSWADFSASSLAAADMLQVTASYTRFDHANLSAAVMMSSSFAFASFYSANLRSAILDRSDFKSANLAESDLRDIESNETLISKPKNKSITTSTSDHALLESLLSANAIHTRKNLDYWETFRDCAQKVNASVNVLTKVWGHEKRRSQYFDYTFIKLASALLHTSSHATNKTEVLTITAASAVRELNDWYLQRNSSKKHFDPWTVFFENNSRIDIQKDLKRLRNVNMKVARQYFADHMSLRDIAAEDGLSTYKVSGEIREFKDRFEEIMEEREQASG